MILDALHAVTDVKILSNPSLVVIDNQVATLLVGDEIPVSTGTGNVLNSATGTNNTIINSIDYRSTGIILRVIPRVSPNGNVRLDVEQEISQATNATASTLTPTVSQRKVKSSVVGCQWSNGAVGRPDPGEERARSRRHSAVGSNSKNR